MHAMHASRLMPHCPHLKLLHVVCVHALLYHFIHTLCIYHTVSCHVLYVAVVICIAHVVKMALVASDDNVGVLLMLFEIDC